MSITLKNTDKIGSILLLALSAAIFIVTADFPTGIGETGPDFYPRVIAVLIAFFAVVQLARSLLVGEQLTHEITLEVTAQVVGALALVVAYVLLLPYLGFIPGTIAFLIAAMVYSGVRSPLRLTVVSLGLTLFLYYTFVVFLRIPLPASEIYPIRDLLPTFTLVWTWGVG